MQWTKLKSKLMNTSINKFRIVLYPLSLFYWVVTICRNLFYSVGFFVSKRLPVPTISVGNITIGGTGKTPTVIAIAQILLKMDRHPGIISRGYGRMSSGCITVSDGQKLLTSWEQAGYEPFMIAKRLPNVPVVVDEEKYRGVKHAIDNFDVDTIILDDGFQHRSVERDLDIVLFNSGDPEEYYRMLPYGRLREPIRSVKRADLIIWSRADKNSPPVPIRRALRLNKDDQIMTGLKVHENIDLNGLKVFAFCGIGDPNSFYTTLEEQGAKILDQIIFPDHHAYTIEEIKKLKTRAKKLKANCLVTTEKDWIKLFRWEEVIDFILPITINVQWLKNSEKVIFERLKGLTI